MLYCFMIKTFNCKETHKIYRREFSKKLPQDIQRTAYKKLLMIEASIDVNDLKIPPANRLEKLSGNREGQYSIRINKQYRICFRWDNGSAFDVEIVDYH
ncbi:type II toxin-antitoxin system RelE/ParE family toxin [Sulfurovum sp.]|uniref:type II toxin-antitoxin system RelE/ParE family toxin n=2 Tax=Sulfurovum sp. TaxID=1969726 RepID=UPI0025D32067|nr:type II toxin-antitoxin system RelE/ParE family toxin [Sulfurovum sp.]